MVKIHFNDAALRHSAQHRAAEREGRLLYRTSKDSYRERWFRLCGNLLFYFRTNELGAVVDASDPVGLLVLADCHVEMEVYGDRPFVFSVTFIGEEGRKHFFSGQSQQQCLQWVRAFRECGYNELRTQLESLRLQVKTLTGSDPLLETIKAHKLPESGPSRSVGAAATFWAGSPSGKQSPSTVPTSGPIVPTRRAPSRPTRHPHLLVDPAAATADSTRVHTATAKAATSSKWETFN